METITLNQAWEYLLIIAAALITLSKAWDIVKHWGKKDLREEIRVINEKLDRDKKRIDKLEESNAIFMQALLAMINHEIDGNNIDGLKQMRSRITNFLTTK